MPLISWLPLISCPVRAANADAAEIVSASETTAIPGAPGEKRGEVGHADVRDRERREPFGQGADQADAVAGQADHTSTAGTFGSQRLQQHTASLHAFFARAAKKVCRPRA